MASEGRKKKAEVGKKEGQRKGRKEKTFAPCKNS